MTIRWRTIKCWRSYNTFGEWDGLYTLWGLAWVLAGVAVMLAQDLGPWAGAGAGVAVMVSNFFVADADTVWSAEQLVRVW